MPVRPRRVTKESRDGTPCGPLPGITFVLGGPTEAEVRAGRIGNDFSADMPALRGTGLVKVRRRSTLSLGDRPERPGPESFFVSFRSSRFRFEERSRRGGPAVDPRTGRLDNDEEGTRLRQAGGPGGGPGSPGGHRRWDSSAEPRRRERAEGRRTPSRRSSSASPARKAMSSGASGPRGIRRFAVPHVATACSSCLGALCRSLPPPRSPDLGNDERSRSRRFRTTSPSSWPRHLRSLASLFPSRKSSGLIPSPSRWTLRFRSDRPEGRRRPPLLSSRSPPLPRLDPGHGRPPRPLPPSLRPPRPSLRSS